MNKSKQKKTPKRIHLGGINQFPSYADFKEAFDEYCRKSAAAGVPLTFVRHISDKLSVNTFTNDPLDQDTVKKFVYSYLSLRCKHNEYVSTNDSGPYCRGTIQIRYNRQMNVLNLIRFYDHSNHHAINDAQEANFGGDSQLNRFIEIARQLPDDVILPALASLEQMCKIIHVKQKKVCVGLPATKNKRAEISQNKHESQSFQSGTFKNNSLRNNEKKSVVEIISFSIDTDQRNGLQNHRDDAPKPVDPVRSEEKEVFKGILFTLKVNEPFFFILLSKYFFLFYFNNNLMVFVYKGENGVKSSSNTDIQIDSDKNDADLMPTDDGNSTEVQGSWNCQAYVMFFMKKL